MTDISQWLSENRERVLELWEKRVREAIPPARPLDSILLTNSIPDLYDGLISNLNLTPEPNARETA